MTTRRKFTNIALATAAAALFASGCSTMSSTETGSMEASVHCYGVNKCKGHNDCKSAANACKGHGSCKAHGFISMSKASCDKVGGSETKS